MKMHVLYLHQYFATREGMTGTRSYEFARRLVGKGHRVTMVTSGLANRQFAVTGNRQYAAFDADGRMYFGATISVPAGGEDGFEEDAEALAGEGLDGVEPPDDAEEDADAGDGPPGPRRRQPRVRHRSGLGWIDLAKLKEPKLLYTEPGEE